MICILIQVQPKKLAHYVCLLFQIFTLTCSITHWCNVLLEYTYIATVPRSDIDFDLCLHKIYSLRYS